MGAVPYIAGAVVFVIAALGKYVYPRTGRTLAPLRWGGVSRADSLKKHLCMRRQTRTHTMHARMKRTLFFSQFGLCVRVLINSLID